ncbi:MAG: hypothetical protein ACD_11C00004G0032 [uncultured bacterium]|nr:MAG: hypothetical protein ACD_11C00004G0032 [uncultured bacterium]HBR71665.1 hypothetical protein [Candidatus Moranbacteria bacterium]
MIEVEKKFLFSKKQIRDISEKFKFFGEETIVDVYYDTEKYNLTKNDIWLRNRNGDFQLKIPAHLEDNKKHFNKYQEIEGEEKIRQIFSIAPMGSFEQDIHRFGYKIFCRCRTVRKKYKKDDISIDLDEVFFDDFSYALGEFEIMVENKKDMEKAVEKIENFAKENNLEMAPVRGKVIEYLKRKKPEHYQELLKSGVVLEE